MRKLNKLDVPNERLFIERSIGGGLEALTRFSTGRQTTARTCSHKTCQIPIYTCDPAIPGGTSVLKFFDANDAGGNSLLWTGILSNQGGSPGSGAEGSKWYYFKSSSPNSFSGAYGEGVVEGATLRVSGYALVSSGANDLRFSFSTSPAGSSSTSSSVSNIETHVLWNTPGGSLPSNSFTFDFTVPVGAKSWRLGRGGSSVAFDRIRVSSFNSPQPGECRLTYQNSDEQIISGSSVSQSIITYELVVSGTTTNFVLPTGALDVSGVWVDSLPTDVWDFIPDQNLLVFSSALMDDSLVHVKYMGST